MAIFAFFSISPNQAFAQRKNISGQEMGLLTFYKLTGLDPSFTNWVESNPVYIDLAKQNPGLAKNFMEEEVLRLQWGLGTVNPESAFMNIQTNAIGKIIHEKNKDYLVIAFPDQQKRPEPYFPYSMGKLYVAVIMKDLKNFMAMELSPESMQALKTYTQDIDKDFKINIKFTYRGISAEKRTMPLDGFNQHIMLGEIAHWEVLTPKSKSHPAAITLWERIEPWYRTEEEDELINMLKGE